MSETWGVIKQAPVWGIPQVSLMDFNSLAGNASEHVSNILTYAKTSHRFVMLFEADVEKCTSQLRLIKVNHYTNGLFILAVPILSPLQTSMEISFLGSLEDSIFYSIARFVLSESNTVLPPECCSKNLQGSK